MRGRLRDDTFVNTVGCHHLHSTVLLLTKVRLRSKGGSDQVVNLIEAKRARGKQ